MFVFGCLRDYLTNWLTKRMVADLRNEVAEHLAYQPLRFHHDRKSGDLVSRTTNDVALCENARTDAARNVTESPTHQASAPGEKREPGRRHMAGRMQG